MDNLECIIQRHSQVKFEDKKGLPEVVNRGRNANAIAKRKRIKLSTPLLENIKHKSQNIPKIKKDKPHGPYQCTIHVLVMSKLFMVFTRHHPGYSKSSTVKLFSVIEKRKLSREKEKSHCHEKWTYRIHEPVRNLVTYGSMFL